LRACLIGLARVGLAIAVAIAAGCAGAVAPTPEELQERCVRDGGWWRPDALFGGYCEFQSPGFI